MYLIILVGMRYYVVVSDSMIVIPCELLNYLSSLLIDYLVIP